MHEGTNRPRQGLAASSQRPLPVAGLFRFHFFEDRAAHEIRFGQACEMVIEVCFDLVLCLGEVTQACCAAEAAGQDAAQEGTDIPDGIEPAGSATEFRQSLRAPGQVPPLFFGGFKEGRRESGISGCGQGLPAVEGLRGHFTGMIDPEELPALARGAQVEIRISRLPDPGGIRWRSQRPERVIALDEEPFAEGVAGRFRREPAHSPGFHKG